MILEIEISVDDLAAIAHVVGSDPDCAITGEPPEVCWARRAFEKIGAEAIRTKIAKYRDAYIAEKAARGDAYQNAAQKRAAAEAEAAANIKAEAEAKAKALAEAQAAEEIRFQTAVDAAVAKAMQQP